MVKHNNVIPYQHFHKKWARRVKTWLHQPAQKRIRRERRREKAARVAPRPVAGSLRPLVNAPTQKYNSKVRLGRGFTLDELKAAGLEARYAQTVGVSVDHRRTNKSEESFNLNVERLKDYKSRLVVVSKKSTGKLDVPQLTAPLAPKVKAVEAVTFVTLDENLKSFNGYRALRAARNDARLVGIRLKQSKTEKEEKKGGAAGNADD